MWVWDRGLRRCMKMSKSMAVFGSGTMGIGIAYTFALNGYRVYLIDRDRSQLEAALQKAEAIGQGSVQRGKLDQERLAEVLKRISSHELRGMLTEDMADVPLQSLELVVEAVPENLQLKADLFKRLSLLVSADTLLATNTSSLSVSEIAAGATHSAGDASSRNAERVIGMHFFNPVQAMKLVELVKGKETSEETVERARRIVESIGKTPITVKDSPGFASSRLGVTLGLEAMRMVEEGVASAEDIDTAMVLGYNHPVGPLRLTDIVGLDIRLAVADHMHSTLGDERYSAPKILREMVARGELGKKSGKGFYEW